MIEQEILIQLSDDPFDTKRVKVKVPNDVKILSNKPYVLEFLKMYGITLDEDKKSDICLYEHLLPKQYVTKGVVLNISTNADDKPISALIEVDSKFTAYCSLINENTNIRENIKEGEVIDVKVKRGKSGNIVASISDAIMEAKENEIIDSIGSNSVAYKGKVTELINGGYWVDINGITCFMPGSLAGLNKLYDFESLVGKDLIVMPILFSEDKGTIIVSHREYLLTLMDEEFELLKENPYDKITGIVTGSAKFGVFAEFNTCLTGLISVSELDDETLQKFNNREIKPGDEISFWPKDIISKKKIMLSQKGKIENAWDGIENKYVPLSIVKGKVHKLTNYGAFIELEKGIRGLIHKTNLKNVTLEKGSIIDVKILGIHIKDRKITITLP